MGKVRWSTEVYSLPQDLHSINTATTPLFSHLSTILVLVLVLVFNSPRHGLHFTSLLFSSSHLSRIQTPNYSRPTTNAIASTTDDLSSIIDRSSWKFFKKKSEETINTFRKSSIHASLQTPRANDFPARASERARRRNR